MPIEPFRNPTLAIEASGLVKAFGEVRAVDGVDLAVPAGGVYGFLGPNGAGKTTAIRTLATLLRPDGGEARVFGHDIVREPDAVRSRVSLTGQFASVDENSPEPRTSSCWAGCSASRGGRRGSGRASSSTRSGWPRRAIAW